MINPYVVMAGEDSEMLDELYITKYCCHCGRVRQVMFGSNGPGCRVSGMPWLDHLYDDDFQQAEYSSDEAFCQPAFRDQDEWDDLPDLVVF